MNNINFLLKGKELIITNDIQESILGEQHYLIPMLTEEQLNRIANNTIKELLKAYQPSQD